MIREAVGFTDEDLTAWLDGEAEASLVARIERARTADEELQSRIAALSLPLEALSVAFDPARLGAPRAPALPTPANLTSNPLRRTGYGAALAASFALGVVVTNIFAPAQTGVSDWVEAVASYQALYATETLSGATQTDSMTEAVIARAQEALGVDMRPALQIEGLEFKRAQMLAVEGRPLLQMAYLDAEGLPFALCLTKVESGDAVPASLMSHGLAGSSWQTDGVGFVLIGGTETDRVQFLSEGLAQLLQT